MPHPKMLLETLEAFQIVGIKMDQEKKNKNKVDTKMDIERECDRQKFFFSLSNFKNT